MRDDASISPPRRRSVPVPTRNAVHVVPIEVAGEVEESADALAPANGARRSLRRWTFNQLVHKTLVIPFAMIVRGELLQCGAQVPFAERNDAIEAFFLDRPDESLCVRIAVWRARRRPHDVHTSHSYRVTILHPFFTVHTQGQSVEQQCAQQGGGLLH